MPNREEKSERDRDDWFAEPEAPSTEWPLTAEERRDEALPAGGAELEDWLQERPQSAARSRRTLAGTVGRGRPAGALLFTCNGRGTNMFPEPDHDARVVAETLGTQALAGFFCGGELGPVGGKAFLHGFTATLAVFLDP